MAQLTFTKEGDYYVAKFTAVSSFNLHIERVKAGALKIEQKTAGTEYAFSDALPNQKTYDIDITGFVFPKEIRVTSTVEVILGIVTFKS